MKKFGQLWLIAVLMIPLFGTGCVAHRRVYAWTPGEQPYYTHWEQNTHRHHVDYDRRSKGDQQAYWKWRHHQH
ncbi:MAG: hypothetical protein WBD10_12015 [Acidobacteriaceae bacterium]